MAQFDVYRNEGTRHLVAEEHPAEVNRLLLGFLQRVNAG